MREKKHRLRVFENRVLRGIFVANREEVTGECRRLNNEEFHGLHCSAYIIRAIKSGGLRHVSDRSAYRILVGKPEEGDHFEDLGVDGRMI